MRRHAGLLVGLVLGGACGGFWGGFAGMLAGAAADTWGHFLFKLQKQETKGNIKLAEDTMWVLAVVDVARGLMLPGLQRDLKTRDILRSHFVLSAAAERSIGKILRHHPAQDKQPSSQILHLKQMLRAHPEKTGGIIICLLDLARNALGIIAVGHVQSLESIALQLGMSTEAFQRHVAEKSKPSFIETDDPYRILGLSHGVSAEAAAAAYRRLIRETHPDRWHGQPPEIIARAQERAMQLNAAYARLCKT